MLGAGASYPYGLPLGADLIKNIIATNGSYSKYFPERRERDKQLIDIEGRKFVRALKGSRQPSIDEFLEVRPEFRDIGVIAIAAELLPKENRAIQHQSEDEASGPWYSWLFPKIMNPNSLVIDPNLTIVTFNYDRTFELSLAVALWQSSGSEPELAVEAVEKLPVIHVYGTLASVPTIDRDRLTIQTSPRQGEPPVFTASRGIRVFTDERQDQTALSEARDAVLEADNLIFLGFAFECTNLQRLGISPDNSAWLKTRKKMMTGTGFGIRGAEQNRINKQFHHHIALGGRKEHCLEFLRESIECFG